MHRERPLRQCTRWFNILATHFPMLSRAQLRTLALWSFAATLTQHIGSTTCACFLARLFEQPQANFRQRLREFYWEAARKTGRHRRALAVASCFAPLLRWILSLYRGHELVLALDVTLVRDRLAVLSISVVFRGSALPVAWKMLPANTKGAWIEPCLRLIECLAEALPKTGLAVWVVSDRGLQSRRIFHAIVRQGWHPLMRLTRLGHWREAGQGHWYSLAPLLPGPGRYYLGQGHLFKTAPHRCTLIGFWEPGYAEPWLLMTDLPPGRCRGAFYGLRAWIEQGFRVLKAGGYRCERLRVLDPERAERIWLVLAVSLVWTHAIGSPGGEPEQHPLSEVLGQGVRRVLGVHREGWIMLLVSALRGEPLPLPRRLCAQPRPVSPKGTVVVLKPPL